MQQGEKSNKSWQAFRVNDSSNTFDHGGCDICRELKSASACFSKFTESIEFIRTPKLFSEILLIEIQGCTAHLQGSAVILLVAPEYVGLTAADDIDFSGVKATYIIPGNQRSFAGLNPHDLNLGMLVQLVVEMRDLVHLDADYLMFSLRYIERNDPL